MTQSATVKPAKTDDDLPYIRKYGVKRLDMHYWGDKCPSHSCCAVVPAEDHERLVSELQAQLSACQARMEEAEKDARRYRWLRDSPDFVYGPFVYDDDDGNTWLTGEALDRRVDAAITALGADGGET